MRATIKLEMKPPVAVVNKIVVDLPVKGQPSVEAWRSRANETGTRVSGGE